MVKPGGKHLIIDYWGVEASKLINVEQIDSVFRQSAIHAGATVLSSHFHSFGDGCGVTGVLILAESHISIHSWPENNYCAIDIFMCGDSKPNDALTILNKYFNATYSKTEFIERGNKHV